MRIKRISAIILSLIMMLAIVPTTVFASDLVEKDGMEFVVYETFVKLTNFKGTQEEVVIPSKVNNLPVTQVKGFAQNDNIKTVKIPNSVEIIDEFAFYECKNLEKVEIGNGVEQINRQAFYGCEKLDTIKFVNRNIAKLNSIGNSAFAMTKSLRNVELPKKLQKINYAVFSGSAIEKISIPDSVNYIGKAAFNNTNLKSINLPPLVKVVYANTFNGCKQLEKVVFEGKVKEVYHQAFVNCNALKSVNFTQAGLKSIGKGVFYNCSKLEKITVSNTKNAPKIVKSAFGKTKRSIKFYVKNKTVAKKIKKTLKNTYAKTPKIFYSKYVSL